ncbi:MAG: outer membrane beta-barrel protein [Flavipsychrobacter sp.]
MNRLLYLRFNTHYMLKKTFLLGLICLLPVMLFAQDVEKGEKKQKTIIQKPSRDFIMLQFTYEGWSAPDSIATTGFGRGFNGYLCYDFPISKSNFSFAAGIGVGISNIYLKDQEITLSGADTMARFIPETTNYKKYKLTTTYLEAPFELRFFGNKYNRNKGFKAAVGLRVGTLMGAHTKAKEEGTKIVRKTGTKVFLEGWRFAGTARIGWGNFTLFGSYNLNKLYQENLGPEITPYSMGICITGL